MASSTNGNHGGAVAVYCGSSMGKQDAHVAAARSIGKALALQKRSLVYGGGSKGIMGVVSGAVLENGGKVTGIIPHAMIISGGEGSRVDDEEAKGVELKEKGREAVETVSKPLEGKPHSSCNVLTISRDHNTRSSCSLCMNAKLRWLNEPMDLSGCLEVLEVTTWTQLGIHDKPVVLCNVLGFWNPLRELIRHSVQEGFIRSASEGLIIFVDGPASTEEHLDFDWGTATLAALDKWAQGHNKPLFDWAQKMNGLEDKEEGRWIAT
ncbi:hypothetical protein D9756_001671 [Leucocoprinus leucothites]|uniref:Uncharacterized protein n=1 Tax=Leucocoprinus leucothites TaxID=201217 RepID=A0A8H5G4R5_9AGAR|nr:hypothetical protein D9756_001671 [Leucoagaricus leucothites]